MAGGVAKGRRLESPDVFLRPMMAKVRVGRVRTFVGVQGEGRISWVGVHSCSPGFSLRDGIPYVCV